MWNEVKIARVTMRVMKGIAHLVHRLRGSLPKMVREGIRLLAASHPSHGRLKIAGLGKFSSGRADLGSIKKHLRSFGQN